MKTLERETGFEPATSTLARSHSTAELLPLSYSQMSEDPSASLRTSARGSDAAQTPQVTPAQFYLTTSRSLDCARDFGSGLGRPLSASSYSRSATAIINKPHFPGNGSGSG